MNDCHFDQLAQRFTNNIYGSNKGAIRLAVLQADLQELLLPPALRVLDIGCGQGHMALWLAQQGHQLTLCEPAAPMLELARERFAAHACSAHFIQASWQQLLTQPVGQFDLVLCHAVLEWLVAPFSMLPALRQLVATDGWLSLAFYNRDALIMQNLIKGNLRKVKRQSFSGEQGSLTPQNPIEPAQLQHQLAQAGWQVRARSGIRVFHDYMRPQARAQIADAELIETELAYRRHPTFAPLGRYQHWLCQ